MIVIHETTIIFMKDVYKESYSQILSFGERKTAGLKQTAMMETHHRSTMLAIGRYIMSSRFG